MSNPCDNRYKASRNRAGLTQEQAVELLELHMNRPIAVNPSSTKINQQLNPTPCFEN